MLDIADDADNSWPAHDVVAGVTHEQIFANRGASLPVPIRNGLINQYHRFAVGRVVFIEPATLNERHAERRQIRRTDHSIVRFRPLGCRRLRTIARPDVDRGAIPVEWHHIDGRSVNDPGNSQEVRSNRFGERHHVGARPITAARQRQTHRQ